MIDDRDRKLVVELLKSGSEIVGASALGAAAAYFGGPAAGAALGAAGALLPRFTGTLIDQADRLLSKRERVRIGAAAATAAFDICRRAEAGEKPRSDEFFAGSERSRSAAEEIFEGSLQKARIQHEELKAPYFGHLFASISFDQSISRGEANRLLDVLDRLTYRKMCLLVLLHERNRPDDLSSKPVGASFALTELYSVAQDCFELEATGLLHLAKTDSDPAFGRPDWRHTVPSHLRLADLGLQLVELARLHEIPRKDLDPLHALLRLPN